LRNLRHQNAVDRDIPELEPAIGEDLQVPRAVEDPGFE